MNINKSCFIICSVFILLNFNAVASDSSEPSVEETNAVILDITEEATKCIETSGALKSSNPYFPHKDKFMRLCREKLEIVGRLSSNRNEAGELVCYIGRTQDVDRMKEIADEIRDIDSKVQEQLKIDEGLHTKTGKTLAKVFGVGAVQKLGKGLGYCYRGGKAVPAT